MANARRVFGVPENRRAVVRSDLMEGVPDEILIVHDFLVGEFIECLFLPFKVALELLPCSLPATFEQALTVIGVDGGCSRELTSSRLLRNGHVFLI